MKQIAGFSIVLAFTLLCALAAAETRPVVQPLSDDTRLDQTVTFSAAGLRLADVLAKLGAKTGVVMSAGSNENDWMVYDRKLIIYVTGMKLRELMDEISGTLSFVWGRTGEQGKWSYIMLADEATEATNRALLKASDEDKAAQDRKRREKAISEIGRLLKLSETDALRLKSDNPWGYLLATGPMGRDTALFLESHPPSREAFLSGARHTTAVAALDPGLQQAVRRIAESYDSLTKSIGAAEDHSALLSHVDKLQVSINRKSLDARDIFTQSMLGSITIGYEAQMIEVPVLEPESAVAKAMGTAILRLNSGTPKEEVSKYLENALAAAAEQNAVATVPKGARSDADLLKPIQLYKVEAVRSIAETLKVVADTSGLNVVSDYFQGPPAVVAGGQKPLGRHLEAIGAAYGVNWEKSGRTLRFRDLRWLKKRTWEIPQVWIDYWTDRGSNRQGLGLEELVQIAKLRDEQIDNTVMTSPELLRIGAGEAARNRHILRFYASLDQAQRAELASRHLPILALTDGQWKILSDALAMQGAAYAGVQRGKQTLKLGRSGSFAADYTFTFQPEGSEPPVTFTITTGIALQPGEQLPPPKTGQ